MQLIVKGRHLQLTDALKEYVDEKIGKHIERVLNQPAIKVEVELSDLLGNKGGTDKECRITLAIPHGKTICITELADDMYAAIDSAKDRLARTLKREREKSRDKRLRSGTVEGEVAGEAADEGEETAD